MLVCVPPVHRLPPCTRCPYIVRRRSPTACALVFSLFRFLGGSHDSSRTMKLLPSDDINCSPSSRSRYILAVPRLAVNTNVDIIFQVVTTLEVGLPFAEVAFHSLHYRSKPCMGVLFGKHCICSVELRNPKTRGFCISSSSLYER